MSDLTQHLARLASGDDDAAERVLELVYAELRQLAAAKLSSEGAGHTLQPTALVHEAWLRLAGDARPQWRDRRYFFGACAEAMRRILIERARAKGRLKRGGDRERQDLDGASLAVDGSEVSNLDLLALDEALEQLAADDPQKAELVKLRFFAGLSLDQVAQTMELSPATVDRHWAFAKAFLFDAIEGRGDA